MPTQGEMEPESLEHAVSHILEEARMLLPGIQALFGFQLIAVFNQPFEQRLGSGERIVHLVAVVLVALSVALVLAPAAYHRQAEPGSISNDFVRMATRLLSLSLAPLLVGIVLDAYLIARLCLDDHHGIALGVAALLAMFFASLWFVWPWHVRRRVRAQRHRNQGL